MLTALLVAVLMFAAFAVNRSVVQPKRHRWEVEQAERRRQVELVRRRQSHLATRLGPPRSSTRTGLPAHQAVARG